MTRHHAHLGNHRAMVLAGLVAVVCAVVYVAGMVRAFGGIQ